MEGCGLVMAATSRSLKFAAGSTTTIGSAAGWQVYGGSGHVMTLDSITAAAHTISCAAGIISVDYLAIGNSTANGGATFYAGRNSTNSGNNSGWNFVAFTETVLSDSITLIESFSKIPTKVFTESVTMVESLLKNFSKTISESITLTEIFTHLGTFYRSLTDSISLSESFSKMTSKTFTEVAAFYLLLETGGYLLEEDGGKVVLEPSGIRPRDILTKTIIPSTKTELITLIETFRVWFNGLWYSKIRQNWNQITSSTWYQKLTNSWHQ